METDLRAGVVAVVLAGVAAAAGAQQQQVFKAELPPAGEQVGQGNVLIADDGRLLQRLKEQLNDPQQRLALRAQHRTSIEAGHPDLAEALGIDAATEQKFFDLLADQQLQGLADLQAHRSLAGPELMQAVADAQTKIGQAQRAVLGDAAMERYRDYLETLPARLQVGRLDARLASGDKLQAEQKARLITLLHEYDPLRRAALRSLPPPPMASIESSALTADRLSGGLLLDGARRMEDELRVTLENDRQILARAAGFMRAPQLAALGAMRTENVELLRRHIEHMRARAGAELGSAAAGEVEERARKAHAGNIKVAISVTVDDGKPTLVRHAGPNGQTIELEASGLIVEVTPTLYEGNWLDARLAYYEQGPNGRRHIGGGNQGGVVSPQSLAGTVYGGGSSVVMGRKKAYVIETGVTAAAL
jgi:hypothetical protein